MVSALPLGIPHEVQVTHVCSLGQLFSLCDSVLGQLADCAGSLVVSLSFLALTFLLPCLSQLDSSALLGAEEYSIFLDVPQNPVIYEG